MFLFIWKKASEIVFVMFIPKIFILASFMKYLFYKTDIWKSDILFYLFETYSIMPKYISSYPSLICFHISFKKERIKLIFFLRNSFICRKVFEVPRRQQEEGYIKWSIWHETDCIELKWYFKCKTDLIIVKYSFTYIFVYYMFS